ncbi:succinylglutamate desuccinylase/aspartoacylase family protein [Salinirubrum litoreum]|uniref:Succinylglutamate desuccinylase/aspartoacylase family protein n=1 Tax=Salinirubrum litoreum TaxID=1126234 RepID=A0ABD5RC94_9EURY|nr:succinylglutamate desuccinylase/aspartoacylase family protein [Salinirubrum litoreum]
MHRRSLLARVGTLAAGAVCASGTTTADTGDDTPQTPTRDGTILPGTRHETPVYLVESDGSGPTVFVIGGIHGDERSGARAASRIARWEIDAGRLVVVPRANRVALARNTRAGVGGDLNRAFPPEGRPETELARALWDEVVARDPDVLVDCHSSRGIYGLHREYVGQAVFPAADGRSPQRADRAVAATNEAVVPWSMPFHEFERGNLLSGDDPLLAHRAVVHGVASYLVETTRFVTDLRTRTDWTVTLVEHLLAQHGIDRAGDDATGGDGA